MLKFQLEKMYTTLHIYNGSIEVTSSIDQVDIWNMARLKTQLEDIEDVCSLMVVWNHIAFRNAIYLFGFIHSTLHLVPT